jgi:hypothetical protein
MNAIEDIGMEIEAASDPASVKQPVTPVQATALRPGPRINLEPDQVKNGLGQLVLTLVKMLHELLERQALRRIEAGTLTPDEIERIGVTLMNQTEEIGRLQREFGLSDEDLNLDLGPLGTLL